MQLSRHRFRKMNNFQKVALVMLVTSIFLLPLVLIALNLRNTQRTSSKATNVNGLVTVTPVLSSSSTYSSNSPSTITLKADTQSAQIDGIQLAFTIQTTATNLSITTINPELAFIVPPKISKVANGYQILLAVAPTDVSRSFSARGLTDIAQMQFQLTKPETVQLIFDQSRSKSTIARSKPVKDSLKPITNASFAFITSNTTPSSTPKPSSIPTATSRPVPSAIPTPTNGRAQVVITSQWDTGFCAQLKVENFSNQPLTNWQVRIASAHPLTFENTWNATFTQSGQGYLITPPSWAKTLAPNAIHDQIGFCAKRIFNENPIVTATVISSTAPPATLAPQPTATPLTPTESTTLQSNLRVTSEWETGFCASVSVTNRSATQAVQNWQVVFTAPQAKIDNIWNGSMQKSQDTYTLTSSNTTALPPGGKNEQMGFCGMKNGANFLPTTAKASSL